MTPLYVAAQEGKLATVKALVQAGAGVNIARTVCASSLSLISYACTIRDHILYAILNFHLYAYYIGRIYPIEDGRPEGT